MRMADESEPLGRLVVRRFGDSDAVDPRADTATVRGLLGRGSCRSFRDQPVPEPLLNALFAAAFSAPSKSDLQQASVVHVADADRREALLDLMPVSAWARTAPVLLVWLADGRRFPRAAALRDKPFANDHLDAFFNAAVDAAIVLAAFVAAAESAGLGCCPISEIRNRIDAASALLDLPKRVVPVAGMAVGWRTDRPHVVPRLPLAVTVHRNRYDDTGLAEAIDAYDRQRAMGQPVPPERQRAVDRFGAADLYGWSEDRGRQYAEPQRTDFGAFVRRQGFRLD